MTFSPQLEAKFSKLLSSYPPGRQRSAMVPMLLFAQDEVGSITQEVIEEIARRLKVFPLQVEEVLSYYSMLHRQPLGTTLDESIDQRHDRDAVRAHPASRALVMTGRRITLRAGAESDAG